jgi:hypothetical protein
MLTELPASALIGELKRRLESTRRNLAALGLPAESVDVLGSAIKAIYELDVAVSLFTDILDREIRYNHRPRPTGATWLRLVTKK